MDVVGWRLQAMVEIPTVKSSHLNVAINDSMIHLARQGDRRRKWGS